MAFKQDEKAKERKEGRNILTVLQKGSGRMV